MDNKIFLIDNIDNYKLLLDNNIYYILNKYTNLIIDYYIYAIVKTEIVNNIDNFIIIKGLKSLTHIFIMLLQGTNNTELTIYNTEKSKYLFIEFIQHIKCSKDDILSLKSYDAILYIYKKTIFDIKPNNKNKKYDNDNDNDDYLFYKNKNIKNINIIRLYVNIIKQVLIKLIESNYFIINNNNDNNHYNKNENNNENNNDNNHYNCININNTNNDNKNDNDYENSDDNCSNDVNIMKYSKYKIKIINVINDLIYITVDESINSILNNLFVHIRSFTIYLKILKIILKKNIVNNISKKKKINNIISNNTLTDSDKLSSIIQLI